MLIYAKLFLNASLRRTLSKDSRYFRVAPWRRSCAGPSRCTTSTAMASLRGRKWLTLWLPYTSWWAACPTSVPRRRRSRARWSRSFRWVSCVYRYTLCILSGRHRLAGQFAAIIYANYTHSNKTRAPIWNAREHETYLLCIMQMPIVYFNLPSNRTEWQAICVLARPVLPRPGGCPFLAFQSRIVISGFCSHSNFNWAVLDEALIYAQGPLTKSEMIYSRNCYCKDIDYVARIIDDGRQRRQGPVWLETWMPTKWHALSCR